MKKTLFLSICVLSLFSCSTSSTQETTLPQTPQSPQGGEPNNLTEWSIPISEVLDGGPGKDGIPALLAPNLVAAQEADFLDGDDLIIGFKSGINVRAYPHIILDWHEIINDKIGDVSLAITYCPLTGTGIGWNRRINEEETTFGVSGLLYNTNLIPYDRATNSNWSQILNESVNGKLKGTEADLIMVVETDWQTWKSLFPNTKVATTDTGFSRTYGSSPYGDYSTNNNRFLFPVIKDDRLPLKERVHAIVDGKDAKVYLFNNFTSRNILKDSFKGKSYMVVGNSNFMVSFELNATQDNTEFTYVFNGSSNVLLSDDNGNQWGIFGETVTGNAPALEPSSSFMGYWFSIPAFYSTEIYE